MVEIVVGKDDGLLFVAASVLERRRRAVFCRTIFFVSAAWRRIRSCRCLFLMAAWLVRPRR